MKCEERVCRRSCFGGNGIKGGLVGRSFLITRGKYCFSSVAVRPDMPLLLDKDPLYHWGPCSVPRANSGHFPALASRRLSLARPGACSIQSYCIAVNASLPLPPLSHRELGRRSFRAKGDRRGFFPFVVRKMKRPVVFARSCSHGFHLAKVLYGETG